MIFILVLSLGIGAASIAISYKYYNRYELNFIKYLIMFLIALNAAAIVGIFYNYFGGNLKASFAEHIIIGVEIGYRLIASLIIFVVAGSLIFMLRALIHQEPSKKYIGALISVWLILMGFFFVGMVVRIDSIPIPTPLLVNMLMDQLIQYIVLFECIRSYYYTATIKDLVNRSHTRGFIVVFSAVWLALIVLSFLLLKGELGDQVYNLTSSIIFIVFNALPLIFLGLYLRKCYGDIPKEAASVLAYESIEDVFARFDISPREQDIVKLVCEGYSNKKIADELCISLSTVKDHNYRIFRKLGVDSRIQLANMFKSL